MVNIIDALKTLTQKVIDLDNNTVDKTTMANFYSKRTITPVSVTWKNGWSKKSLEIYINGNIVSTYVDATRSSKTGAGNITDIEICAIKIPASIGLNNFYNCTSITSGSGGIAAFKSGSATLNSDGTMSYSLYIVSTHAATTRANFWMDNLVSFNPDTVFDTLA